MDRGKGGEEWEGKAGVYSQLANAVFPNLWPLSHVTKTGTHIPVPEQSLKIAISHHPLLYPRLTPILERPTGRRNRDPQETSWPLHEYYNCRTRGASHHVSQANPKPSHKPTRLADPHSQRSRQRSGKAAEAGEGQGEQAKTTKGRQSKRKRQRVERAGESKEPAKAERAGRARTAGKKLKEPGKAHTTRESELSHAPKARGEKRKKSGKGGSRPPVSIVEYCAI